MANRIVQAWGVAVACFTLLMMVTPSIPQPQMYHDFADKREFYGIPNALNVVSNFPFAVIGLVGLMLCHSRNYSTISLQGELWGWTCFYVAVASVAFGSSYYHLGPNDNGLVWDRMPMTVAFASLLGILIIERVDVKMGTMSLLPLLMAGIVSSVYWRFFDDIRPYLLAQSVSCIAIPLMAFLLPPRYTHSTYWLWASGFYPLAMLQESTDRLIYACTFHMVSGHTLKHLSAAMVPLILTVMLAKRSVHSEKLSHVRNSQILQFIEFTTLKSEFELSARLWPKNLSGKSVNMANMNELALAYSLWISYEWMVLLFSTIISGKVYLTHTAFPGLRSKKAFDLNVHVEESQSLFCCSEKE